MICSGSIALLLAAAGGRADSVPSAAMAARVCGEVAERMHVDTSHVRLQWGQLPALTPASDSAPLRIVGGGTDGWYLVVVEPSKAAPHSIRVRAGELRAVAVASHALHNGQQLTAADITLREGVVWSTPAQAIPASLLGWEVRRDVAAGTLLGAGVVIAPRVIVAGDKVVFAWQQNGVRIEREAIALGPARLGEIVQGRAGTSRLEGRATGHDAAELKEVVQ